MESPVAWLSPEILEHILLHLDARLVIRHCLVVCRHWRRVIASPGFWLKYIRHRGWNGRYPRQLLSPATDLPWTWWARLVVSHLFGRNLIRNAHGELVSEEEIRQQAARVDSEFPEYPGWTIHSSGGTGWRVREGAELPFLPWQDASLAGPPQRCFETSEHSCTKSQAINLLGEGLFPDLLESFRFGLKLEVTCQFLTSDSTYFGQLSKGLARDSGVFANLDQILRLTGDHPILESDFLFYHGGFQVRMLREELTLDIMEEEE
eukprot:maker-scaffold356_size197960-snap-gene-0.28 protein:Tk00530 transcript:maker-scaffold356_size197960-snap-gene-0.28-mRNA-1 annotation:"f-box containing"